MSVAQLKETIHEGIENLNDERTLEIIQGLISRQYDAQQAITITAEQHAALRVSQADLEKGNTLTRESASAAVTEWLQKRQ